MRGFRAFFAETSRAERACSKARFRHERAQGLVGSSQKAAQAICESSLRPPLPHQQHKHLYQCARWRRRRTHQLRTHPWCAMCAQRGVAKAATVADHVVRHHGDRVSFYTGALQSLCKACHDSAKRLQELRGHAPGCDELGNPLDPTHPWYADAKDPQEYEPIP